MLRLKSKTNVEASKEERLGPKINSRRNKQKNIEN